MAANDPTAYTHYPLSEALQLMNKGHQMTRLAWAADLRAYIDSTGLMVTKAGSSPAAEWTTCAGADFTTKDWYVYA